MFANEYDESVKNMRNRTVRLDREGDYWTEEERETLIQKFHEGEGITAMALQLQRTESAIIQQIEGTTAATRNRKTTPIIGGRRSSGTNVATAPRPSV